MFLSANKLADGWKHPPPRKEGGRIRRGMVSTVPQLPGWGEAVFTQAGDIVPTYENPKGVFWALWIVAHKEGLQGAVPEPRSSFLSLPSRPPRASPHLTLVTQAHPALAREERVWELWFTASGQKYRKTAWSLQLASEVGVQSRGLSLQPMGSDAISRQASERNGTGGHPVVYPLVYGEPLTPQKSELIAVE